MLVCFEKVERFARRNWVSTVSHTYVGGLCAGHGKPRAGKKRPTTEKKRGYYVVPGCRSKAQDTERPREEKAPSKRMAASGKKVGCHWATHPPRPIEDSADMFVAKNASFVRVNPQDVYASWV